MAKLKARKNSDGSFYDRYFFLIWLVTGYFATLLMIVAVNDIAFERDEDYLLLVSLLIGSPVLAAFWYTVFVITGFALSLFREGIVERSPGSVFVAFWLLLGLLAFVVNAFL